jgi:tetratricopeptide (TPR) repeat protein
MWLLALTIAAQSVTIEDPAFGEAMRLVEEFEYERAVFRFREALRHDHADDARALINLQLGMTYAELGEEPDAVERFADALALDGRVNVPNNTSPKTRDLFEQGRATLAKRRSDAQELADLRAAVAAAKKGKKVKAPEPVKWEGDDPTWSYIGAGVAVVGALAVAGGVGVQLNAVDLVNQGNAQAFQDDAAAFNDAAVQAQYVAYGLVGAGASLALIGGAIVIVSE